MRKPPTTQPPRTNTINGIKTQWLQVNSLVNGVSFPKSAKFQACAVSTKLLNANAGHKDFPEGSRLSALRSDKDLTPLFSFLENTVLNCHSTETSNLGMTLNLSPRIHASGHIPWQHFWTSVNICVCLMYLYIYIHIHIHTCV